MSGHAGYILAAYGITAFIVLGLLAVTLIDHRRLRRALERFPGRGDDAPRA